MSRNVSSVPHTKLLPHMEGEESRFLSFPPGKGRRGTYKLFVPIRYLSFIFWLILLPACTMEGQIAQDQTAVREELNTRLVEVRQAQASALALWDRVIFGEAVSCEDAIVVPQPIKLSSDQLAAYAESEIIQARLNEAIIHISESSQLWDIECQGASPVVPLTMAKEGRATALSADGPLAEAAMLLGTASAE